MGAFATGGQPAPGLPGEPDPRAVPEGAPSGSGRSPEPVPEDVPGPLSPDRLARSLRALGYHYFVDSEGDVGGLWFGRLYHFFLIGDERRVLQVRGRWHRRIAIDRLPEVLAMCDRWNRELIWPKCYVRVLDDGLVHVMTEISTPYGSGATDAQIRSCIQDGLACSGVVFDALDERYPDPAASAP